MRIVRSAGDCELARRTARVDAVVAVDGVEELRRRIDDLPVAAWLPAPSTERAAELLELGVDEVLDGAMGERELSPRVSGLARRAPAPVSSSSAGSPADRL